MNKHSQTLQITKLINQWVNRYLPTQGSLSRHTTRNYSVSLALFLGFLEVEKKVDGTNIIPDDFKHQTIEDWLVWLAEKRNNSPATCNDRLGSIRSFLKYMARKDTTLAYLYNEAALIPLKKSMKKPVEGISKKAMKALLEVPDQNTKSGRAYLTMFVVMYNTGVRLDELLSLKLRELHLDDSLPHITVVGKGSKIRTISLLPRTVKLLKRFLNEFHGNDITSDHYVFYSRNKGPSGKLSQVAVNKQLKHYSATAHEKCPEIPASMHCHQIRHSAASHWLANGMNIVQISALLGHSNVQTTMVYIEISLEMKTAALEKVENPAVLGVPKKWKKPGGLAEVCGLKSIKRQG
ncbi:MAG: site-specific integrase [Spirochaetia bacterium]|nr:site-specific integrase [Spirochaetia bacterium]